MRETFEDDAHDEGGNFGAETICRMTPFLHLLALLVLGFTSHCEAEKNALNIKNPTNLNLIPECN